MNLLSLFNSCQTILRAWIHAELSLNSTLKPVIDHGYVITVKEDFLAYLFTTAFAGRCKGDVIYCFPRTSHDTPEKNKQTI